MTVIAEIRSGVHDADLNQIEMAVKNRRNAIADEIKSGDVCRLISSISPKYLANAEVQVLRRLNNNFLVELVDKRGGGRFANGPFTVPPSYLILSQKGEAPTQQDLDDLEDAAADLPGGLTMRDLKVGDKVITGDIHPSYIANKKGYIAAKRRIKVHVMFDNPPVGTRFANGVVIKPSRLVKQ
jgi:hypothetical protein